MSNMLENTIVTCPYCGEALELLLDLSEGSQQYVEDCHVCCRPMEVILTVHSSGEFDVAVTTDMD